MSIPMSDPADWLRAVTAWQQQVLSQNAGLLAAALLASGTRDDLKADRRFASGAWTKSPYFAALSDAYLRQVEAMNAAVDAAASDERTRRQWRFMLRQVTDAASPANCLATNPEAIQAALDSGGSSLGAGMRLLMEDVRKGRISMADDDAFEVGRNVGTSPGGVVFENELMQLIQYTPSTSKVYKRPLLIVPPCINKFYILDLQPENSLVAYAVAQGHTVFLISWRNVGAAQGHLTWDDYLDEGVLRAIKLAQGITRTDRVNTLGFCVGGTLLACALAVSTQRGEDTVASMTLLTTMLDFTETGEIGLLVDEAMVAKRESSIGTSGLLKGRELAQVFAALRANDLIWPYVVNSYLLGKAPPAFDLLSWNGDDTNLPGPMYCWYLRNTYLENRLKVAGGTVQCGQAVDFRMIKTPTFLYASQEDHIVPWNSAYASTKLLVAPTTFVLGASGHIAGVINPPSKGKRHHWVGAIGQEAEAWLAGAKRVEGSWWPAWSAWLAKQAGPEIAARRVLGSATHRVIEPAPGRYVKEKAS